MAGAAAAQNQRPLPSESPELVVAGTVRVNVIASDELEPDVLRALARPQVTLWLTTTSNTLRDSTVETLARFEASFVQLRFPLKAVELEGLRRSPRAGLWLPVDPRGASLSRFRGARPLALEVEGALDDERYALLLAQRPSFTRWAPVELDLLAWSRFLSVPGRKSLALPAGALLPQACDARSPQLPSAELHVATLLALSAGAFPCGSGTRVEVAPDVEPWLIKSLIVRDPSVELVVRVGDDVRKVGKARALLELLGR